MSESVAKIIFQNIPFDDHFLYLKLDGASKREISESSSEIEDALQKELQDISREEGSFGIANMATFSNDNTLNLSKQINMFSPAGRLRGNRDKLSRVSFEQSPSKTLSRSRRVADSHPARQKQAAQHHGRWPIEPQSHSPAAAVRLFEDHFGQTREDHQWTPAVALRRRRQVAQVCHEEAQDSAQPQPNIHQQQHH